ncbi:glycoside hydrolase family 3 C-terminal domain-containing protein [Streptomyces uncialis]|uniref:glycoside hydrolase family 3 C-terminal domain-containing protein n=1 Tax=Streptomyces uncialis TaxID=1048205 RepID=UPI00365998AC
MPNTWASSRPWQAPRSPSSTTVGSPPLQEAGRSAQRRSLVLLKNDASILPLTGRPKVYAEGFDPAVLVPYADPVATPEEADVALLRLLSPWEERDGVLGGFFHGGSLDFPAERVDEIRAIAKATPTVACVYLERPAILTPIDSEVTALLGDFGSHPDALLDLLFGRTKPEGKLPFDLPSSSEAVETAREDVPFDTRNPLYKFGHGLTFQCCPQADAVASGPPSRTMGHRPGTKWVHAPGGPGTRPVPDPGRTRGGASVPSGMPHPGLSPPDHISAPEPSSDLPPGCGDTRHE